jgi:integrase
LSVDQIVERQTYNSRAKAANTRKSYSDSWRLFWKFCQAVAPQIPHQNLTIDHLWLYILDMKNRKLKVSTIQTRIAGPLEGVYREIGGQKIGQRPLLQDSLHQIVDSIGPGYSARQVQDRALILLTWHTAIRREESCNLEWEDLDFKESGLIVTIRKSKTEQLSEGQSVGVIARTDKYCSIKHLLEWKGMSGGVGSVWRTIGGQNRITDRALTVKQFYTRIKKYCTMVGLDPAVHSPHSLRSGVLTQGAINGASVLMLQKQSRHKHASGLDPYIRDVEKLKNNIGEVLH